MKITRRAPLFLVSGLLLSLATLACNLPGVGQQPAVTETANANASATSIAGATFAIQSTVISQTQTALAPTPTPAPTNTALPATLAATAAATVNGAAPAAVVGTVTQTSIAKGALKVGVEALVQTTNGGFLNMRDTPSKTSTKIIAKIPGDTRIKIIDGPKAADGLLWWKVQVITSSSSAVNQMGWCAESDGTGIQTLQAAQ